MKKNAARRISEQVKSQDTERIYVAGFLNLPQMHQGHFVAFRFEENYLEIVIFAES